MMGLRVRVTISKHGTDPDNGEQFLTGCLETHPEANPVVSQNIVDGTLAVSFTVEAEDAFAAAGRVARQIFAEGASASGLSVTEVVDVTVTQVDVESETR